MGYKIGCVAEETQKKMGLSQPARGTLWKSELFESGVELNKEDYSNPAMEAELGVKLNRDIDPKLVSFNYILDSIESIYPLIEIHNLVFNGDPPFGAELLANNAIHAGVVMGKPTKANIKSERINRRNRPPPNNCLQSTSRNMVDAGLSVPDSNIGDAVLGLFSCAFLPHLLFDAFHQSS